MSIAESEQGQDLKAAFQMFTQMSQQLTDSYSLLENRVAQLNQELNVVTAQRFEELAEKERLATRLESLLNVLPGGVVVLEVSGRVSESNPAAEEMLGVSLQGMLWRDVIARCFAPRQDDGHEVSTRDGRRISIATRSLLSDGQIILLTDQTETRRLQSELSRHERLSALGKMLSALAHQIRTPLSAAMLYAGHLCNDALSAEKRQNFSEKILNRLNNIERQVRDMLLFVKGELLLNDEITVAELKAELIEAMEVPLLNSKVECLWENNCSQQRIRCNKEALIGALLNLVNNAIQAMGDNPQLLMSLMSSDEKTLAITVSDNGPGIDESIISSVGDIFVTTKAQGTGLGLAVVKAVARGHNGKFVLHSESGRGVQASILLPLLAQQDFMHG